MRHNVDVNVNCIQLNFLDVHSMAYMASDAVAVENTANEREDEKIAFCFDYVLDSSCIPVTGPRHSPILFFIQIDAADACNIREMLKMGEQKKKKRKCSTLNFHEYECNRTWE